MRVTQHAAERIAERTRMRPEEIVTIIEAGAFVSLGMARDTECLLFHSHRDDCAKIAVVDVSRSVIISIWHATYQLPRGIVAPSSELCALVRERYFECVSGQIVVPAPLKSVEVYMDVLHAGRCEYTHFCGRLGTMGLITTEWMLAQVHADIELFVGLVEQHQSLVMGSVSYRISALSSISGRIIIQHTLAHQDLVAALRPATT